MICSWKPGALHSMQVLRIKVKPPADSQDEHGAKSWLAGGTLCLSWSHCYPPVLTQPLQPQPSDLAQHKPVTCSLCLNQAKVKSLSSLFLHIDFSKLSSEHQSSGKGHNPAPPLSASRRGKWSNIKCTD